MEEQAIHSDASRPDRAELLKKRDIAKGPALPTHDIRIAGLTAAEARAQAERLFR